MERVVSEVDKATGYVFAGLAGSSPGPPEFLYGAAAHEGKASDVTSRHQEHYLDANMTARTTSAPSVEGMNIQERTQM